MIINNGDIVKLKSGGPQMTVDRINAAETHALCCWFAENGEIRVSNFSLVSLIKL